MADQLWQMTRIREEEEYKDIVVGNTVFVPNSKKQSFQIISPTTLPAVGRKNAEPSVAACPSSEQSTPGGSRSCAESAAFEQLWSLARGKFKNSYTVPDWSGWLSKTCDAATLTSGRIPSKIGYMAPILHPITEFATVKKCLDLSVDQEIEAGIYSCDHGSGSCQDSLLHHLELWRSVPESYHEYWTISHNVFLHMGSLGKVMCESRFEDMLWRE